ncbi:dihydrodipicolinate synthase family protein [Nonomuraea sp. K274]|uniref:Dihydrodipicolinate synthase family protein n=1 Tax=Nonomuraea cypriaca TaxID=1187855 RepID=A0A931AKA3_9ACTN|nr:dihydrodipicolinate synthase family protein [Nonomuraea cypriaca]MBF8191954.1 dihydrodipicolinate synthase family protein [Nonomuraea cypriaca]
MSLPYTRAEVKDRARAEWRGLCNVTLPSFTSDFSTLNAAGIAHDVRLAARYGFWGTLVASESGTTLEEYLRFMEIAAESAPEGFRLVAHLSFSTVEEELTAAKAAEALGFEAALLSYPPSFRPGSAADVVEHTRYVAERTDLALILFAVMTWGFTPLHASGFPPAAIEEMARIDTAAALKYEAGGAASITALADVHRRVSEHVLVENPMEQHLPALVDRFGTQWFGTSAYESFGDRVPRVHELATAGKWNEAMDVFWSYQPARAAKGDFHASFKGAGLIHRVGWKYLSWLQGFNGGLLRMPQMRLSPGQMRSLRAGLAASGFHLPDGDDGFFAGRNPA